MNRRSTGREIILDENCHIIRGEGAATFELATGKKTYYLTADSTLAVDDWVRVLQVPKYIRIHFLIFTEELPIYIKLLYSWYK